MDIRAIAGAKRSKERSVNSEEKSIRDKVVIRPLDGDDSIHEITELLHRAFKSDIQHRYVYPAAEQDEKTTREQIRRGECWVAELDERLVGIGIVWPPGPPARHRWYRPRRIAHLRQLAVEPDLQGLGIGTLLLNQCEEAAIRVGASELGGSAPVGSRQISLYMRKGYRVVKYVSWSNTDYHSAVFSKYLSEADKPILVRRFVEKMKYYLSFAAYKLGILGPRKESWFLRLLRRMGISQDSQEFLKKLTRIECYRRRLKLWCTKDFWKIWLMGLAVLRMFCWAARLITARFQSRDYCDVLLNCPSCQCAEHLRRFSDLFKDDFRLRFNIVFPLYAKSVPSLYERMRKFLPFPEVSNLRAYICNWSMVVVADHPRYPLLLTPRKCPTLYIGHGPVNKSTLGSKETRPYGEFAFKRRFILNFFGKKKPLYPRMFEGEERIRELAVKANPSLNGVVVVVGNLVYDQILSQVNRREEFRRQLGIKPEETVVLVLSTWRPECLFRSVGDAFLEESHKLLSEFRFILSIHPSEYLPKPPGERVWGEYLRTQKKYGYIVREPDEDYIPYMVASDIVLTDHTSMADYAVLLQKPIICVPVDPSYIWKGSITWEIYQFAPVLHDMRKLRSAILEARNNYPRERLAGLARTMNPYPGEVGSRIRKEVYQLLQIDPPE